MKEDATINRIREARHRISEACEHDPQKLVSYFVELQKRHQDRLIQKMPDEKESDESLIKA
ncbi:MAG: hypothetical protein QOC96_1434 [Acidobacteriota bacterium]|jgi:hypothetical protein|nr:hypothetical protein [Acidobacteriota bacterium]